MRMCAFLKRLAITPMLLAAVVFGATAQEAVLGTPDAKVLGMGGVSMSATGGSHAIYNNSAMAIFSAMPAGISSSYYGQQKYDYYAVSGFSRVGMNNIIQGGWRHYLREKGDSDMALDVGYSRRIGDRWAVGVVARYMHIKRPNESITVPPPAQPLNHSADALAVDLSAAWSYPIESWDTYSTLRAGAKLSNLGGFLNNSNFDMPMQFTAGAALDMFLSDVHELTLGVDAGYYFTPARVRSVHLSAGVEYNLSQLIQFRGGYHLSSRSNLLPSYGSVGMGVRFLHLRLDFAYLLAKKETPMRNTYSVSFGLDF